MTARDTILGALRRGLAGQAPAEKAGPARQAVLPIAEVRAAGSLAGLFAARAEAAGCTLSRVGAMAEVPGAVRDYLAARQLPQVVQVMPAAAFGALDWAAAGLEARAGAPPLLAPCPSLSVSCGAIAETGTIALTSAAGGAGLGANLFADHHIVVLTPTDISATPEDFWRKTRQNRLPRSIMLVTGPSRTGDIEMTIELGAHGAKAMHVIIVATGD